VYTRIIRYLERTIFPHLLLSLVDLASRSSDISVRRLDELDQPRGRTRSMRRVELPVREINISESFEFAGVWPRQRDGLLVTNAV